MEPCAHIPPVLRWHYWATLIRLFISLAWGMMFVIFSTVYRSSTSAVFPVPFFVLSINDILILTLDFKRTDSYAGTVLAQTMVSVPSLALPATFIGMYGYDRLESLAVYIPNSVHIICTLYLSISLLLSKRKAGANAPWKSNAKDVLLGVSSSQTRPSWLGHPRNPPLRRREVSRFPYFWTVYVPKILFRRVSPVESKQYAFFQNFCALFFVITIIIRAAMVLAQAQNQIETRSGMETCYGGGPAVRDLRLLVRHQTTDMSGVNPKIGRGYDVGVQITTSWNGQRHQCTSEPQHAAIWGNWFQVFNCGSQNNSHVFFSEVTYNITIRSTNGTSLHVVRLPDVWFANFADTFRDTSALDQKDFMSSVAPWLVPPWQMIGRKHVEGNIGLIERRFITSSVFRDIVASLKPTYKSASLLTITTTKTTASLDNFTSTALLTPSFASSLSYLNSPASFLQDKARLDFIPTICAVVEDYRSSTIFDAIGSIGGLLAILQGVHILLFGRPMFWGLSGAKLINPFGILGSCHSRGFRRRLREQYHRQPTEGQTGDAAETIRINAFLRDFVIDFGPADVDDEEDTELGRGRNGLGREANHDKSRGDNKRDANDSLLLLPRYKTNRQTSQSSTVTTETTNSRWET